MDRSRLPFARALFACGFVRDGAERDPLYYKRRIGDRTLSVQLWKDGLYRVSHGVHRDLPGTMLEGCCETTTPTVFRTVAQMHAAILTEIARTDHKPGAYGYPLGLGAAHLLIEERRRQREVEGWTPEHDDQHPAGVLTRASICYALNAVFRMGGRHTVLLRLALGAWPLSRLRVRIWPWSSEWWKPRGWRRDLERAGALIVAELEKLDRDERRARDRAWDVQSGRAVQP